MLGVAADKAVTLSAGVLNGEWGASPPQPIPTRRVRHRRCRRDRGGVMVDLPCCCRYTHCNGVIAPMDWDLITANLLDPAVLFFFAGFAAVRLGSDLELPQPLPKFLSMYLLLAIGFRGGAELAHSGLSREVAVSLVAAVAMALFVPVYGFLILKRKLSAANAAAVAATYGSVSAVTFIAAVSLLTKVGIPYSGHMIAALALMESPAIVVAVLLYRLNQARGGSSNASPWRELLREAFLNGSVFLLVASMLIGLLTGDDGVEALRPFTNGLFKGMLCLFLLDMGLVSSRRVGDLARLGAFPLLFATLVPLCNATIAIAIAGLLGMSVGNAFLFTVLSASASYIAVPAAMRLALPEANPGIYVTMALVITFPMNILLGLPLYLTVIERLWG